MTMPQIGFIGQGWIGKNYANDFEARGYSVVRYSLDKEYIDNKERIQECDIVFIAVPTPTTKQGFSYKAVEEALSLVGNGKIAVVKSTIVPGTTTFLQKQFPNIFLFHSPEFLREVSAAYDAAHPNRNIVGYTEVSKSRAEEVLSVLPASPWNKIMPADEAEFIKYAGNIFLYFKVLYANTIYDYANSLDLDFEMIKEAVSADPRIGESHMNPIHSSGRGAGGNCFIKDFEAFLGEYKEKVGDTEGVRMLEALRNKNIKLLVESNKDIALLKGVYGEEVLK